MAPKKGTRSSGSFEQCSFCQRRRVRVVIVVKGPRQGHVTLPFLGGSRYALEHSPGRLGPALDRPLRPDRAERFSLWRARASGNEAVSEAGEAAASTNHGRPGGRALVQSRHRARQRGRPHAAHWQHLLLQPHRAAGRWDGMSSILVSGGLGTETLARWQVRIGERQAGRPKSR